MHGQNHIKISTALFVFVWWFCVTQTIGPLK